MDTAFNSISARLTRILDANFYAPHTTVAYRFPSLDEQQQKSVAPEKLRITESEVQRMAQIHAPTRALPVVLIRQWLAEFLPRILKGANIRKDGNANVFKAYEKISPDELKSVNMRQHWAAWRAIPRSLSNVINNTPLFAVDLCCGLGESSQILAHYLPEGSKILGVDFNSRFVASAKSRARSCAPTQLHFRTQSVLDPLRDESGTLLPKASVDLVHSIGALACHFTFSETKSVVKNAVRVLRPGGILILDMRKSGRERRSLESMILRMGFKHVKCASSCAFDRTSQECFQKI